MGILDNIARNAGSAVAAYRSAVKGKVGDIPDWLSASAEGERWKNEPNLNITRNQQELYTRLSWFAIAVSHLAKQVAGTPLNIKELQGEKRIEIDNHPFELILGRPNESQSRFEFIESLVSYKAITGNGYAWLNKATKESPPDEMWIIPSDRMRPVPDERMYIRGYMYDTGHGEELPLESWEVMHLKRFNPQNQYVGLSAVEALAIIAEGDLAAQRYNTNYFSKNNAKTSGILTFADAINNTDWATIKDDFKKQHGGTKRNLLMLRNTGQKGINWVTTAMTQKDMEFLAGRDFTKKEIWAIIAPGLASWLDVNSTEANSKTGKEAFMELAVWPEAQSLSQKITNDILPTYGDNLIAEFEDVRVQDKIQLLKEQEAYERTHTIDEVREKFYGDKPLGDERDNLTPLELTGRKEPGDLQAFGEAKAHERNQFHRFAKARKGKPNKISSFKFKHLDLDEQEALIAGYVEDDTLVELTRAIDAVRESNGHSDLDIFGKAIDGISRAVQDKQPITINVEGQKPTVVENIVPEQKAPVVNVKVPKQTKQAAPNVVVENTVNVPEAQVIIQEDKGTEIIEVMERDEDKNLKTLRKTKE